MALHVLTHEACLEHRPPDERSHVERPERLVAARRGLEAWRGEIDWHEAEAIETRWLYGVHTPDHVRRIEQACHRGTWLDADTYAIPASWEASLRAAGAAIGAAERAMDHQPALALARPPGHHATAHQAMGFCLFNNVALAAEHMTDRGLQVAIVDIDVHHGNGTQEIFYDRGDVLYVSLHQSPFYPGTGEVHETGQGPGAGTTVNLPVPAGTGHAGWLELIDRVVQPVLETFAPDALLISAGYDAHRDDPIGGLELVAPTFHQAVSQLAGLTPRVAAVLEGGYSLSALEACLPATAAGLTGQACPVKETIAEGVRPWGMLASKLEAHLADRWPLELEG